MMTQVDEGMNIAWDVENKKEEESRNHELDNLNTQTY
jgi:hypothetical protein